MNTYLVLQLLEVSYLSCGFTVNVNCSKTALAAKGSDPPFCSSQPPLSVPMLFLPFVWWMDGRTIEDKHNQEWKMTLVFTWISFMMCFIMWLHENFGWDRSKGCISIEMSRWRSMWLLLSAPVPSYISLNCDVKTTVYFPPVFVAYIQWKQKNKFHDPHLDKPKCFY